MRISYFALLVAVAVLTHVTDAQLAAADSQLTISESANSLTASENVATFKRFLRADKTAAEDDEERGINIKAIPGLEKLTNLFKTKITPGTLIGWANKEKSSDYVFLKLKLDKTGNKLFDNPDINVWTAYANAVSKSNPETAMLATLTSRYSDDVLSEMIIAAMKVQNTKKVATNLQTEQVQSWLTAAKSPDDVFNWFLLDKAGDDLLTSPQLATWMNYLKLFNKNNPKQQTTLVSAMTKSYGDEGVVTILEGAKLVPSTAKTAKRLETEQLQLWLKNKKSPDDVFKALMLNKAGDDLFTSPQLNTFTKYMNSFNKENDKQTTLIAAMTTGYGDNKLWTMLQTAKTVPNTKRMATDLEAAQYQYWLSSDRGPNKVFKALSLDKAGDNLLSSPQFATFIKYTNEFHAKNLDEKMTTMWTVRAYYTDFDVAKMIMAGEKVPSTQKAAARMEGELFKSWMAPPETPDDAFRALKLTSSGDALFENPMLSFWTKFLDDYNKVSPGKNTYRSILTSTYDDKTLVKMIDDAKKNPSTKTVAEKVEKEMLFQFILDEKQPKYVATLLNVNEKTDPNWKRWKKYMQDYHKYHIRGITT